MHHTNRREFLRQSALLTGAGLGFGSSSVFSAPHEGIPTGQRALQHPSVKVLNPRDRVPVSFIIDDSTCLVNMGHFCMPQFASAWPNRDSYKKPWQTWPREIPDSFVREYGEWCAENDVRGKYSIVPYPACVGWLDRELPGWSRRQLTASLDLVRTLMLPNWDIHPEMITHTRVIDLKSGRPFNEINAGTMENSYPQEDKSVDEMAAYLAYALKILKNCDLPCEGITTPGGFGNRVKPKLSQAVFESVRDVYGTDLPHYFKYVVGSQDTTQPQLEYVSGIGTDDVRATVNVVAGTGDWFGGWDGDLVPQPDRYATQDGSSGRMIEMIEKGEPAVFLCHWPGMYSHGEKTGFRAFQRVVRTVNEGYKDRILWMKVSEIARYWAAKELTTIDRNGRDVALNSPFSAHCLTLRVMSAGTRTPVLTTPENISELQPVTDQRSLEPGTWMKQDDAALVCIDLPRGQSKLTV